METDWIEQDKLLPGDCAENDQFGLNVKIEGDYALVTSQYDDNEMGHDAGALYILKEMVTNGWNWINLYRLIVQEMWGMD